MGRGLECVDAVGDLCCVDGIGGVELLGERSDL